MQQKDKENESKRPKEDANDGLDYRRQGTTTRKDLFGDLEAFMMSVNPETIKFCMEFMDKKAFFP